MRALRRCGAGTVLRPSPRRRLRRRMRPGRRGAGPLGAAAWSDLPARLRPRSRPTPLGPSLLGLALFFLATLHVPAPAAANEWLRHDTDHFRVIYRAEDADDAARVVELAPSVWQRTTRFFQYQPSELIPVVLYGETARANGFFTPYPPQVALFTAAPAGPWMGARTEDWLESVFVHEVTHYLHLMRPIGFFGTASRVFGPLAAAGGTLFLPGWALEGPTTTAETTLTSGGRGRNPYFEMEWVAPILADEMYGYDQAGVGSAYPPRGRIYSAGYIMTDHLLQEYGEETFVELNREFQRWPFLGMRRALRRTTGRSGPKVYQDMVDALSIRYASRRNLPDGESLAEPTDSSHRRTEPLAQRHLLTMTDRGAVALHRSAFDPGSVQLLEDGGAWRHLAAVTPLDEYSVAISANGEVAAAVVQRADRAGVGGGPYVSFGELYLIDLDRGTDRRVTSGTRLFHPAIDATGATVIGVERTGRFSRLVRVDPESGEVTPIYAPPERFLSMPALSRDGRYLAAVENDSGKQSIVVLERGDASGTSPPPGAPTAGAPATVPHASPQYTPVYRIDVGGEEDAEYRPLFAGARDLWFVGDSQELLQLYRTTLPDGDPTTTPPIERILTDQVGVISGVPDGDGEILYGTYRSHGYTVRRGLPTPQPEVAELRSVTADYGDDASRSPETEREHPAAAPRSEGAPTQRTAIVSESRPYRDLPRPVLWFPTVNVAGEVSGTTRFDLGAGLIAVSNLARHNLQAFAAYDPTDHKPSGSVAYTYTPGPTSLSLTATADYSIESDGSTRDLHEVSAAVARPLWYDQGISHYRGVVAQVGGSYEAERHLTDSHYASLNGAARMMRNRYAGAGQIFGGTGGELQSALHYRPELLDQMEPDLATVTFASLRLGRRTGWLHLQPTAALATSGSGAAVDNLPWRASPFTPEGRGTIANADGAILGRLALTAAAPPLDVAWRGVSLQNVGSRLYLSQAADLSDPTGAASGAAPIAGDNYTVAGAELTVRGQFNLIPLQLTAGIAVRLPHGENAGRRRTQFYVNLGGAAVDQISTDPSITDRFVSP